MMGKSVGDGTGYVGYDYHVAPVTTTYKSSKGGWSKCAHKHPPLKFVVGDHEYTVYGGACGDPIHTGLDIYVALDHGTANDPRAYPWHGSRQFIYFPISDMSVPKDAIEFKLMVEWLADQITAGKSVHIGCLGGHGRTGMVLAALVRMMAGEEDAITYVRDHYCQKAVETSEQAKWLNKNFGIKVVNGYKDGNRSWGAPAQSAKKDYRAAAVFDQYADKAEEVKPFRLAGNIWGIT
jgi:hypothetical protein